MPTVSQGASALVDIAIGQKLSVSTSGEAYVDIVAGPIGAGYTSKRVLNGAMTFGPYGVAAKVRVRAVSGTATHEGASEIVPAQMLVGPTGDVAGLVGPDGKAISLGNGRQNVFDLLPSKQPLGIIDNVIDAGTMFADFSGTRLSVLGTPASAPTITRDYTGMDAAGNVTGIVSRTGLPSMVLVEPTADSSVTVGFSNSALGNVATDGLIGLWVYADLSAKATAAQTSIGITPFNTTGWNANNLYIAFNANQIRHGWNFLIYKQKDVATNLPASETVFSGLSITKAGTGAGSDLKGSNTLKYIEITLQNFQGVKLYFDSMWTGFSTKPQFVLGVDQASNDTISIALPIFRQYGWVGYFATPRRVWGGSGSKIIGPWSPNADGNFANMRALYDAGWDCINHSTNHYALAPETNAAAIRYEVEASRAWYLQNGFVRGAEFYASPQSSSSILSEKVIADAGFRMQRHARRSNVHITPFGIDNPNHVGAIDIGNRTSGYQKFSDIKKWIDNIVLYGATGFPFWHTITTLGDSGSGEDLTGSDLSITKSAFEMTMAYLRQLEQAGTINVCRGVSGFWYGV